MIKEGILKENIDGEALKWAAQRILFRPEKRKILIIISDGAPLDEVTIANNPSSFLSSHLKQVIFKLKKTPIELFAIGIGHEVDKYYLDSITLKDYNQLGQAVFDKLFQLFV
jgi:cobaltochelatase CobT